MQYTQHYDSPLGGILLAADEVGLTGLWFDGAKYFAAGQEPDFPPPLHPCGSAFRQEVWALLRQIPYGQTTTYGALAARLAAERGLAKMSAQAVCGAVGHNPISLIILCHRVVGTDGSLTGYAGGIDKKARLLALEKDKKF